MSRLVKDLDSKPDNLSLVPRSSMVEGENQLPDKHIKRRLLRDDAKLHLPRPTGYFYLK